jgi:integrase/recombinase XerD
VVLRCCPKLVRVEGPLALYASGFAAHLLGQGYTPASAEDQLRLMAHLSRWLAEQRMGAAALTAEVVDPRERAL